MSSVQTHKPVVQPRGLDAAIAAARFSNPQPPEQFCVTIGRSELLAHPRRKKDG